MPRWARFLSCSLTGLLLTLFGFILVAYGRERTPDFWQGLQEFLTTPEFWGLFWLFGLMAMTGLLAARALVHLWPLRSEVAGLLTGSLVALCYVAFLLASQLQQWGGLVAAWPRIWPDAAWALSPFALAGACANWLWERFDG